MTSSQPLTFVGAAQDDSHVRPFVYDADGKRALHFSICTIQSRLDLAQTDRRGPAVHAADDEFSAAATPSGAAGDDWPGRRFAVASAVATCPPRACAWSRTIRMCSRPARIRSWCRRTSNACVSCGRLGADGVLVMDLHAQEPREARILARIHRSFGGVVLAVFDSERGNCIAFACHGSALRTLRPGQLQRPQGFDPEVWPSLQCDMARVLGAWREEFA